MAALCLLPTHLHGPEGSSQGSRAPALIHSPSDCSQPPAGYCHGVGAPYVRGFGLSTSGEVCQSRGRGETKRDGDGGGGPCFPTGLSARGHVPSLPAPVLTPCQHPCQHPAHTPACTPTPPSASPGSSEETADRPALCFQELTQHREKSATSPGPGCSPGCTARDTVCCQATP